MDPFDEIAMDRNRRHRNRQLYPAGNGELPDDAETRALLYLKPSPQGYVGHLPDNFDLEDFQYDRHTCHDSPIDDDQIVCTACYSHPKNYLGQLSVECPKKAADPCSILLFNSAELSNELGINPATCETGDGTR